MGDRFSGEFSATAGHRGQTALERGERLKLNSHVQTRKAETRGREPDHFPDIKATVLGLTSRGYSRRR